MLSSIPTPANSVIGIGPLTVHYYALCIILGVAAAIWLGNKRYRAFASNSEQSIGVVAAFTRSGWLIAKEIGPFIFGGDA